MGYYGLLSLTDREVEEEEEEEEEDDGDEYKADENPIH